MPDSQDFGATIRKARLAANIPLREAARRLDISPSYLSRLEHGDLRPPPTEKIRAIAALYQLDFPDLLMRARSRVGSAIVSDNEAGPFAAAFFRLAHGRSTEEQRNMLKAAIGSLQLPDDQKRALQDQIETLLARMQAQELPRLADGDDGLFALDIKPRFYSAINIETIALDILRHYVQADIDHWPWHFDIDDIAESVDSNIHLLVETDIPGRTMPDGSPEVLGLSRWSQCGTYRELVVHAHLFESNYPPTRRRGNFTIAHELFHCLDHLPLVEARCPSVCMKRTIFDVSSGTNNRLKKNRTQSRRLFTNEDWREWQANRFAASILMPAPLVRKAFSDGFKKEISYTAASNVSQLASQLACERVTLSDGTTGRLCDIFDVNPQPMAIRLTTLGLVAAQQ